MDFQPVTDWDGAGRLTSRRYHDGALLGIFSEDAGSGGSGKATLSIRGPDGDSYQLLLTGVSDLVVDDFRMGNIVSAVLFLPPSLWRLSFDAIVREKFGRGADGPLFAVVCSYGAMVLALCAEARIRSVPAPTAEGLHAALHEAHAEAKRERAEKDAALAELVALRAAIERDRR